MPFTPFHLGPGALLKAGGGRCFSFTVFAFTQLLVDLEPLYLMMNEQPLLHGFLHTLPGVTLVMLVALAAGKPLCSLALRIWNKCLSPRQSAWLAVDSQISWTAAASGAAIGTYSHVLLDALVNPDVVVFPGMRLPAYELVEGLCLGAAAAGVLLLLVKRLLRAGSGG